MLRQLLEGPRTNRRHEVPTPVCRSPRARSASSGRDRRGTATGRPEPTRPTPTGGLATCPRRWTGCRSPCGSSPGGRTFSSVRPSTSTGTCATAGSRCRSPSARGPTRTCSRRAGHGSWARRSSGSTATSRTPAEPRRDRTGRLLRHRGRRVAYRVGLASFRRVTGRSTSPRAACSPTALRPPRSAPSASPTTRATDTHAWRAVARPGCRVPRGLRPRAPVRHPGLRERRADANRSTSSACLG